MKITISERFRPFSHTNGTKILLPLTSFSIQIFPTRLYFTDLSSKIEPFFLSFDFQGPLKDFTAELDLEKGWIKVFGMTQRGYVRYCIWAKPDGIWLTIEKTPTEKIICDRSLPVERYSLCKAESLLVCNLCAGYEPLEANERLSLGENKAQNWQNIHNRLDFKEIFPLWLLLSHWIPSGTKDADGGNYLLLNECREKINNGEKTKVVEVFQSFFLSAFEGILVPRLYDTEHQGILSEVQMQQFSLPVLPLLKEGAQLIRSLFFLERPESIEILPCLPPQFHCGRLIGWKSSKGVSFDIEWTKKSLRRMQVFSNTEEKVGIKLPKGVRSCRLKRGRRILNKVVTDQTGQITLQLTAGQAVDLDRFEK